MNTITRKDLFNKLGAFKSVKNCVSRNGCGLAQNQFDLTYENGRVFQSYSSLIAVYYDGCWYFTDHHDFSPTTIRHCNTYCGMTTAERRKGLAEGKYVFITD